MKNTNIWHFEISKNSFDILTLEITHVDLVLKRNLFTRVYSQFSEKVIIHVCLESDLPGRTIYSFRNCMIPVLLRVNIHFKGVGHHPTLR